MSDDIRFPKEHHDYALCKIEVAEERVDVVGTVTPFTSPNYCQAGARYHGRQLHDYIDEINDFGCVVLIYPVPTHPVRVYPKSAAKPICALRQERSVSRDISYYFTIKLSASGTIVNMNTRRCSMKKNGLFQCDNMQD